MKSSSYIHQQLSNKCSFLLMKLSHMYPFCLLSERTNALPTVSFVLGSLPNLSSYPISDTIIIKKGISLLWTEEAYSLHFFLHIYRPLSCLYLTVNFLFYVKLTSASRSLLLRVWILKMQSESSSNSGCSVDFFSGSVTSQAIMTMLQDDSKLLFLPQVLLLKLLYIYIFWIHSSHKYSRTRPGCKIYVRENY